MAVDKVTIAGFELISIVGEAGHFTVWRALSPRRESVLLKAPVSTHPPAAAIMQLESEYEVARGLDPTFAVRPLQLERHGGTLALVLEDFACHALADDLAGPLPLERFFAVAVGATQALAALHRQGVVHKDIKPENILVAADDSDGGVQVKLTGFGMASLLARERQAPDAPELIAGTLAYIAPEQTGRMNRSVDSRSDLYSLGITFYRMLAGRLPFAATEPMEWVHCHVALKPAPPSQYRAEIPAPLSDIVLKLLAKNPEDRYQTAAGLKADLESCAAKWRQGGDIKAFALGTRDIPEHLLIPEKLYGREQEIGTLLAAFKRTAEGGRPEMVLVSGYSGVGKSSVVNELHKALVSSHGLYASGKFDQSQRNVPYSTLVQAFEKLIRLLLGKSEAELDGWRRTLETALEPNGRLIMELVGDLKLVLGEQPPVPELEPKQAKARFQRVFRHFVGVFARREHPLVLFFDDLQWADAATLDVMEDLLTQQDTGCLLFIGAYRDNEVGPDHPLTAKLESISNAGLLPQEIKLEPLAVVDLTQLVADTLHCGVVRAEPLARLVHTKTAGNPFFAIEFLSALADEGLIAFDRRKGQWSWNLKRIRATKYTDNVANLLARKLTRLSGQSQDTLQKLACLGSAAGISTLSLALEMSKEQVPQALAEAIRQELVQRLGGAYRFAHDRVLEAAYALIPEASRAQVHLRIGRLLLAGTPEEHREETVFEIVNQLNLGEALIDSVAEREELARLNLVAGKRAEASTAYASALKYFIAGRALLAEDCWQDPYGLAFTLELHRAECEFLTGDVAAAEERLAMLWGRAQNLPDLAALACLRMPLYMTLDQSDRAVSVGLEYLQRVGIVWSPHPTEDEVQREFDEMWRRIGDRAIEALAALPQVDDPVLRGTLDVLAQLIPPAVFTDGNLHCLITAHMANFSLKHGNGAGSCFAYVWLGMLLGPLFGDYEAGFRFGQVSVDLTEKHGLLGFKARVYLGFSHVVPWTRHVRTAVASVRTAIETAQQTGDLSFASISRGALITHLLASGEPLESVQLEAEASLEFAQSARFGLVAAVVKAQLGLIRTLRGLTPEFGCLADAAPDERQFEEHVDGDPRLAYAAWRYWIRKLQARWFGADYASAIEAAEQAQRRYSRSYCAYFEIAEYHLYAALALASYLESESVERRQRYLDLLADHHRQLETWARHCPDTFENRAALVAAEIARIENRPLDAMRLYEHAVRTARTHGFVHIEALAHEMAGRFYLGNGLERIGLAEMFEARAGYAEWGANGKVKQLEALYPRPLESRATEKGSVADRTESLDVTAIAKAQHAISSEIRQEQLAQTLLRIVLENAGAQRGYLWVEPNSELFAELGPGGRVEFSRAPSGTAPGVATTILNYVRRTRNNVYLADASSEAGDFSADPYLLNARPKSVLCLPILRQAKLLGILYLENNLAAGVFTPGRRIVLDVLASQAAISLENARTYEALRESEAKFSRIVNTAAEGILVSDADGVITFVNPKMAEMLGYSEHEIQGRPVIDFLFPEDLPDHSNRMGRRHEGKAEVYERRFRCKDGQAVWASISAKPIFDDEKRFQGSFGMVTDISERKRAVQEMSLLNFALSNVREGVAVLDERARFRYVNDELLRELGYGKDEFLGFGIPDINPDYPIERWQDHWRRMKEQRAMTLETRHKAKDGHLVPVEINTTYFEYDGVGYILSLVRDISERRQVEAELSRYREHLEETVQLRTAELRLALDAAEAANRAKSVFLANMSHELRTPLNAILGFSTMMRRDPQVPVTQIENLDIINRSGEHLLALINDVLEVAKIEAGRVQLEMAPFDLGGMIRDVTDMMRLRAEQKGLFLKLDQASEFPRYIRGDETRLRQILVNLLGNAVKFTRSGGVIVRLGVGQNDRQQLLIEVEDTGPGIRPEDRERIFKPFEQVMEGGEQKGTGLGLTITRQFVELMGGTLAVESTPGQGSQFRVELPVELAEAPGAEPVEYRQVIGLAPGQPAYRILIAEDQRENQILLSRLMEAIGLETRVANNGAQCLEIFRDWPADLIWMDRRMPVMDGVEAAQRIRQLPGGESVKIIAVTASAFREQQDEMLAAGMDEFVRKPYRASEIYECMARQLGLKFVYGEEPDTAPTAIVMATAEQMAALPVALRQELAEALTVLDSERIAALLDQVQQLDSQLGGFLSRLAEGFDYPAMLNLLQKAGDLEHS